MAWLMFAVGVVVVLVGGIVLWRRWRRWNPVRPTSPDAKAAEARLWSTKVMDQR